MKFAGFYFCHFTVYKRLSTQVALFYARSQNCGKRMLASSCLFVRPSVRMEQLVSHCTDVHEILYLSSFRKIQVSLKSVKNNGYVT